MALNTSVCYCNIAIKRAITTLVTTLVFSLIFVMAKTSIAQSPIEGIDAFEWKYRVILVQPESNCASTAKALRNQQSAVIERHILWFVMCDDKVTSNFDGVLSDQFIDKVKIKYFNHSDVSVILIGKDGAIKRSSNVLDLASLFDLIDSMPMRQLEMRDS